tara:strand:- start:370 stop:624 length:255 start_codon:yes stop_codon:yes gene_type:complete
MLNDLADTICCAREPVVRQVQMHQLCEEADCIWNDAAERLSCAAALTTSSIERLLDLCGRRSRRVFNLLITEADGAQIRAFTDC